MGRRHVAATAAAVATYAWLQWLGRTAGATRDERRSRLPGDELVREPMVVTTHAATIAAPPRHIWPWLVQMGWHRGAFYTARWVDRLLFPANWPSAERLLPEWQGLGVGDAVPDGAPETECEFVVAELEENRQLVLHSTRHLPPSWWRDHGSVDRLVVGVRVARPGRRAAAVRLPQPTAGRPVVGGRGVLGADHPGRRRHGPADAARCGGPRRTHHRRRRGRCAVRSGGHDAGIAPVIAVRDRSIPAAAMAMSGQVSRSATTARLNCPA